MPGPAPRVSVVIVSWNALPLLRMCLPSVVATDYPDLEIILADNASTDGSADWVRTTFPRVKVVRHPENWKFCRGNNEAIPHTTGTYVVLLNNDVEVPPEWLSPLVRVLEEDPQVAAVQPKLLQYDDRTRFEYAGAAGGFIDRHGYPFTRGRIFFTMEEDRGQYDDARDVFWATGACVVLRRAALDRVGMLDERFEMHMEEIDLCWRLQRAGYRIRVEPSSRVFHVGGGSLPQGDARKAYFNFRNSLLMLYKNLPGASWWRVLAVRSILDALAGLRAMLAGRPREAWAIARAYADAHRMKGVYAERHEEEVPPSYGGSIVVDYFVRGRKHFSELPPDRFTEAPAPRERRTSPAAGPSR